MPTLSRRELLLRAVPAGLAGIALTRAARAASACVQPESESLRASLNYVVTAADPAVSCARCAFFTSGASGRGCGGCQILSGPVDATGHCDSFSPPA